MSRLRALTFASGLLGAAAALAADRLSSPSAALWVAVQRLGLVRRGADRLVDGALWGTD